MACLVVTILLVNSDNASAENLHAEFQAANIVSYAYVPTSTTSAISTWPTLQDLISQSKRLIVFVASLDSSTNKVAPYLLDEFVFIFENPFDVTSPSNFSCLPDRPTALKGNVNSAVESRRLPLMNHFLYSTQAFGIEIPDYGNITNTNAQTGSVGNLGGASTECKTLYGRAPAFILVDFFEQGSAISTVDSLNGITAVGRIPVAEIKMTTTNSSPGKPEGLRKLLTSWPGCVWILFVIGTSSSLL